MGAYLAILLPATAGRDFGCPSGDAIVFVTDNLAQFVTPCLSAPPHAFVPFATNLPVAAASASTSPGTLDVISLAEATVTFAP